MSFFSVPSPVVWGILALFSLPVVCGASEGGSLLTLSVTGRTLSTRVDLYGQNMTSIDWHGAGRRGPILWDVAGDRPDPAWDALTHAYPLRVVRYHSGNVYPWRDAAGPVSERKPIVGGESWKPVFKTGAGFPEFLRWLETLPQKPDASLIASPFTPVEDLADLVAYCNATEGPMAELRASHGHPVPYGVKYWELGNETDWTGREDLDIIRPDTEQELKKKLLVGEYIQRCLPRIAAMRAVDPSIKIFAHAQTSPWPASNPQWRSWHREVIRKLGAYIDGVVIHPYYDGYSVPYVLASIDALIADIKELQPAGRELTVVINEHARWVTPADRANWPQSGSLQGVISTADFLLRCMARPEVSMANYWCYLHQGPWTVLSADWAKGGGLKYGTAIHELFRLFNDTALPRFELLTPVGVDSGASLNEYDYTVTAGLFTDVTTGRSALVAINRSDDKAVTLRLENPTVPKGATIRQSLITADSLRTYNDATKTDAVALRRSVFEADAGGISPTEFVLPPRSVAAWQWP